MWSRPTALIRCCSTSIPSRTPARHDIARQLQERLPAIRKDLPPDVKLAFFYDQSLLVRDSMRSAWEAIIFGLFLSIAHSLPVPAELGHDVGCDGGDSRHRAVDDSGDETLRHEFQPDDAGRHRRGHRPDH